MFAHVLNGIPLICPIGVLERAGSSWFPKTQDPGQSDGLRGRGDLVVNAQGATCTPYVRSV